MSDIEQFYNKKLDELRSRCRIYQQDTNRCPAARCLCASVAECMAYHNSTLPHGHQLAEISAFDGHVNGNRTVENHSVNIAISKIMDYCFGDSSINPMLTRYDLHKKSKMDDRFDNGANLIIYGDSSGISKNKLGKTMLASIVMKEAIWRRMFKTNKAYTYSFKSCPEIVDDTISKKNAEQNVSPFTADWLCIDDIFLRTRQTQGNVLDQIMSVRLRENLPSIIVIQFDPFKLQSAEEAIGNHIMKMLSDKTNTFVVSLG